MVKKKKISEMTVRHFLMHIRKEAGICGLKTVKIESS